MTASASPPRSDLGRAVDEGGEVVELTELGGGLLELTVRLPRLAATVWPGEFAQLRCGAGPVPLLRRPFSVAWAAGETCGFVFERVGAGTRRLAALRPGDRLDALGPLGVGFSPAPHARRVVCVAGGLGCAPFPLTAARAVAGGAGEVLVLSGAATAARLYPAERYARGDRRVRVAEATDDGSRGHRGPVTELVAEALAQPADALYACGPNPMLAALAARLGEPGVPRPALVEVSLEAPMGCGVGTCLGCALPVAGGGARRWALCCREGPVMAADRVDWEGLSALPPAHVA